LHAQRLPPKQARRAASRLRTAHVTDAAERAAAGFLPDVDTQLTIASAEEIAAHVAAGTEGIHRTSLTFTLRAPSREALEALDGRRRDRLMAAGCQVAGCKWEQREGFLTAGVPYAADRLGRVAKLDTTSLAMSFPFLFGDVGTRDGALLGVQLADGRPLRLNTWDTAAGWPGPHMVLVAPNGAGKTVTIGHLCAEWLTVPEPPQVLFIDPAKRDFGPLTRAAGGRIVSLSTDPQEVINPYDVPPAEVQGGTGDVQRVNALLEHVRQTTGLIALLVAEPGQRLSREERAVYEEAALAAYRDKGITPDDPPTWGRPGAGKGGEDVPLLRDVVAALEAAAGNVAASLARRLQPYVTGTLSRLFDRPTTLTLKERVISFDLSGLDADLRPVAVWTVGNLVWKLARTDRHRRILSLDEVKTLLAHEESARLVGDLYALARAFNLMVLSASQLTSDYEVTQEGERVLQNAYTALLLRHARGKGVQEAGDRYGLSTGDRRFLESCGRGEGVLVTPKGTARVRVTPSPWLLELMGGPLAEAAETAEATEATEATIGGEGEASDGHADALDDAA
ncbi:MAG: VirB4 family type IV secretion system protein, partial [Chloroflexota bacterium]